MRRDKGAAFLLGALVALVFPAAALAAPDAEVGIEDERLLLAEPHRGPEAVRDWAALGVDVVRIHARWWAIAPGEDSPRRPRRFDAADHKSRRYDWGSLDHAVDLVTSRGMRVMLTVTGPAPLWASRSPARRDPRYKPDPDAFAEFAHAAAARYGGRVDRYLIWNEPNQPGWLQPQSRCRRRGECTPVAPHLYRGLVRAATPAIAAADPGAQVLVGELAPTGRRSVTSRTALAPLPFLRAMACVDGAYRPLRRGLCGGFKPVSASAFGYHPHSLLKAPDARNPDPNEAQLGDLERLTRVLDRLTATGRLRAPGGRFDLYLTEYGYQTAPPDRVLGVSPARQARYLQQAAYMAWSNPRVRNLTQYLWYDEPVVSRGPGDLTAPGWQSGLLFVDGRSKPARGVFASPFVIDSAVGGGQARLWGQVRPGGRHAVSILRRRAGEAEFAVIGHAESNAEGYWSELAMLEPGSSYRFSWKPDPDREARRFSGVVDFPLTPTRRIQAAVGS
jgi:hypothetical protein